jgi:RNA polymerase sigma-70 factor (ECF subfamily)
MREPRLPASEAELIQRARRGDGNAFYELVRPYERMSYAIAISVLKNSDDAEEIAQEAILKAFVGLKSFRAEAKFSTWLMQISYNEARMRLRKARAHLYESLDEVPRNGEGNFSPKDFADWQPIPSEVLEEKEIREAVHGAINSLSPIYREVLILRDVQHLSVKETTTILGISETSVKTRLHRARLQLREALAPGLDGWWSRGGTYRKVRAW